MGWTRVQTKKVSWYQITKNNSILHFSRCILPDTTISKEPACQCRRHKRCRFNPCVRKIPWRRKWQPTPVFLPGKSHGQTSLEGYSLWGRKESNMTEQAHTHYIFNGYYNLMGLPSWLIGKESACNAGDVGLIPG